MDPDDTSIITFSLDDDGWNSPFFLESNSTGRILLKNKLTQLSYQLNARVFDQDGLSAAINITVSIRRPNTADSDTSR